MRTVFTDLLEDNLTLAERGHPEPTYQMNIMFLKRAYGTMCELVCQATELHKKKNAKPKKK